MDQQESPLSDSQREIIVAAKELESLKRFPGWRRVETFNEQWIEDALERLAGSSSSDPQLSHALKLVYSDRRRYIQSLNNWMEEIIEGRKQIIRELAEINQIENPETLVEMLDRRT